MTHPTSGGSGGLRTGHRRRGPCYGTTARLGLRARLQRRDSSDGPGCDPDSTDRGLRLGRPDTSLRFGNGLRVLTAKYPGPICRDDASGWVNATVLTTDRASGPGDRHFEETFRRVSFDAKCLRCRDCADDLPVRVDFWIAAFGSCFGFWIDSPLSIL